MGMAEPQHERPQAVTGKGDQTNSLLYLAPYKSKSTVPREILESPGFPRLMVAPGQENLSPHPAGATIFFPLSPPVIGPQLQHRHLLPTLLVQAGQATGHHHMVENDKLLTGG